MEYFLRANLPAKPFQLNLKTMKKSAFRGGFLPTTMLVCMLLLSLTAFYQPGTTGEIKGKVSDKNGAVLSGVQLLLMHQDGKTVAQVSSGQDGNYVFRNVAAGNYRCKAALAGYETVLIKNVVVTAGKTTLQNFILAASATRLSEVTISNIEPAQIKSVDKKYRKDKSEQQGFTWSGTVAGNTIADDAGYERQPEEFNREGYDHISENEFNPAKEVPLSTFSIDVDRASYSNVRRFLNQGTLPPINAVRIEELINYFTYNYPQPDDEHPFSINTEVIPCPWNKDHQLALIGLQGKKVVLDHMPPANFVFLIDVSGSMNNPDKLPLLKRSMGLLVNELRNNDRVAIVVYAGNAGLVLPSTTGSNKEKIMEAINNLEAGGSTAGGAGINLAYKVAREHFLSEGNNRVILATDGDFNVGVSSDGELVTLIEEKRKEGVFLTVLGFGTGNYQDAKMEKLADKGNGNYAYIDNIMEAQKTLVSEMGGTMLAIAKDVKLQVEFNPASVKEYKLIGYENRLLHDRDFNDDTKDAGELGSGHTVTALYEIIPASGTGTGVTVDPLKYQLKNINGEHNLDKELFTVKFRYKKPDEDKSRLMAHVVNNDVKSIASASENIRFAAAVTGFGMLLRNSKFKGTADYKMVLKMASEAKGNDPKGYRAEFIRLVETAQVLSKSTANDGR